MGDSPIEPAAVPEKEAVDADAIGDLQGYGSAVGEAACVEVETVATELVAAEEDSKPIMIELYVDQDHCVGMGRCEIVEPDIFEIDDDAVSQVIGSALFDEDRAKYVMFECPTGAIKIKTQAHSQEA